MANVSTNYAAQLAAINVVIEQKNAQIAALVTPEAEWRAQSQVPCNQTLKSKREACQADKAVKLAKANQYRDQMAALRAEVAELLKDRETISKTQLAENEATIKLADQGLSNASLQLEAQGKANAAAILAQAQADATRKSADASSQSSKTVTYVIIGVIVIVVVAATIFTVKRLKSKKK